MTRFAVLIVGWAVLLLIGFALVFTLGRPLPTAAEELEAALHPAIPVSEEGARSSAETIVRLEHGQLTGVEPTVGRRTDYGIDYWMISYSLDTAAGPTGVVISIVVDTGNVQVLSFP
ncbi:MAG: hypothetical protein ABI725_05170 [Chloroflexota bacterium]